MRRLLLLLALLPHLAVAGEVTLNYDAVTVIRAAQTMPVLDDKSHVVGTGAFRGLATFEDGAQALHRYDGWFDLTDGEGPFHGYALWTFDDGATIRAEYAGEAFGSGPHGVGVRAEITSLTGTGRFAGASGTGRFEGRRLEPVEVGGVTALKGSLSLTLP